MENFFCICIGYAFYFGLPSTKMIQKGVIIEKVTEKCNNRNSGTYFT